MEQNDHAAGHPNERSCTVHDPNEHWTDDSAYVDEEKDTRDMATVPKWSNMVELLAKHAPEGDPYISRFALCYVNYETGKIEMVGNPGADIYSTTNLLARAISIAAFQEGMRQEMSLTALASVALGALYRDNDATVIDTDEDETIRRMYP